MRAEGTMAHVAKQGRRSEGLCLCSQRGSPTSGDTDRFRRCHRRAACRKLISATPGNPLCPGLTVARQQSWLTALPEDWASKAQTAAPWGPEANTVSTGSLQ